MITISKVRNMSAARFPGLQRAGRDPATVRANAAPDRACGPRVVQAASKSQSPPRLRGIRGDFRAGRAMQCDARGRIFLRCRSGLNAFHRVSLISPLSRLNYRFSPRLTALRVLRKVFAKGCGLRKQSIQAASESQ
jgi:hypothetical protein